MQVGTLWHAVSGYIFDKTASENNHEITLPLEAETRADRQTASFAWTCFSIPRFQYFPPSFTFPIFRFRHIVLVFLSNAFLPFIVLTFSRFHRAWRPSFECFLRSMITYRVDQKSELNCSFVALLVFIVVFFSGTKTKHWLKVKVWFFMSDAWQLDKILQRLKTLEMC